MLEIRQLHVSYGDTHVIQGVDLKLKSGEVLGICGESGTGKTTLGLALMGVLGKRDANVRLTGDILFQGENLLSLTPERTREVQWKRVAMIFQNVADALNPVMTVIDQVAEPLITRLGMHKKEAQDLAAEKLKRVMFPMRSANAFAHELSLGERQRALTAMSIACEPELLIMDEPFSALDMRSRTELIPIFRNLLAGRSGIFISHDMDILSELCDRTAVLYGGMIIEQGIAREVMAEPLHPYTRGLLRSFPGIHRSKDLQGIRGRAEFVKQGCPFEPRCTQSIENCRVQRPQLKSIFHRQVACHRNGVIRLLEAREVSKSFKNRKILDNVSFVLMEGETLGLIGPSGAGKTTLANIIMGLTTADNGNILLEEERVEKRDLQFARKVQMIFQAPADALSHRLNVLEAVREPLDIQRLGTTRERLKKVRRVLEEAELPADDDFLRTYPHHLSGGEAQRVVIARSLVLDPKLLIADEPTASLDPSVQAKIMNVLKQIQEDRGLGILFITHNLALARKICDHIAVLDNGCIQVSGRAEQVLPGILAATRPRKINGKHS